jgi:UDP-glucose 4-epimerase
VTGGAGFVGSHLVRRGLQEDHEVVVLDNFSTGRRENLSSVLDDVELIEGDVRSYERVHTAMQGCDAVLHQAALPSVPRSVQDPLTSTEVNVTGTLNVLLNARDNNIERVVYASSSSIYGSNATLPKHEDLAPAPMSPYAVSKLACEGFCRSFFHVYGLETVSLRYFNIFGPRQDPASQYAAVVPNFITACLTGSTATVYGDGEASRDFTYVDNVVNANMLALHADAGAVGNTYNIACGSRISLNDLLHTLGELTGGGVSVDYQDTRPGDVRHSLADVSRAREDLGYVPAVDLREGLRRTVEQFALPPAPQARGTRQSPV